MKPIKSSKQTNKKKSPIPMTYVLAAGAVLIVVVAVISFFFTGNSRRGGGRIDEAEAQARWKDTGPTKKK